MELETVFSVRVQVHPTYAQTHHMEAKGHMMYHSDNVDQETGHVDPQLVLIHMPSAHMVEQGYLLMYLPANMDRELVNEDNVQVHQALAMDQSSDLVRLMTRLDQEVLDLHTFNNHGWINHSLSPQKGKNAGLQNLEKTLQEGVETVLHETVLQYPRPITLNKNVVPLTQMRPESLEIM